MTWRRAQRRASWLTIGHLGGAYVYQVRDHRPVLAARVGCRGL